MSNLTDALIAAKLVGGSGGSGGGSGLPEITTEPVVIMPQATLSFTEFQGMYISSTDFVATDGETYTVTWDGTDYTCTTVMIKGKFLLGNIGLLGGEDTGEPFVISDAMEQSNWITRSTAATHICKISGMAQVPPDGYVLMVVDGEWKAAPLP